MAELGITWETLLVIAGGLIVFIDLIKRFRAMGQPISDIKNEQKDIVNKLDNDKARLDAFEKTLSKMSEQQEKSLAIIGLSVAELLNHIITGNDIDKLKMREDELNAFFYTRDFDLDD